MNNGTPSKPDMNTRLAIIETQLARIVSDYESEKRTRANVNSELLAKIRELEQRNAKLERIIYMGLGGLAALQFVLSLKG